MKEDFEAGRHQLERNLDELERKTQELRDWRTYYRRNPKLAMGVALCGGMALAAMTWRSESSNSVGVREMDSRAARLSSMANRHADDTWQRFIDALFGVASARALDWIGARVPGFSDHLK